LTDLSTPGEAQQSKFGASWGYGSLQRLMYCRVVHEGGLSMNSPRFQSLDTPLTSPKSKSLYNSSTAIACSRDTVGKFSKKKLRDSPSSSQSNSVCTGTRVPMKTGVP